MDLAVTIVKVVLSIGFVTFGAAKVFPIPNLSDMVGESFTKFGLDDNLKKLTGVGELVGVALLWVPVIATHANIGAALLAGIGLLAVFHHIKFKDPAGDLVPAIMMTALSIFVAVLA